MFKNFYIDASDALKIATVSFDFVEKFSHCNGFRVFNATRGGKLESFERVNFDELFE